MEVIGAVASFIAIGQALGAVPSIVDILKALPTARMELIVLSNEFETLRATHADISSLLDMLPDPLKAAEDQDLDASVVIDPALLRRTEAELMALVSDLGATGFIMSVGTEQPREVGGEADKMARKQGQDFETHREGERYSAGPTAGDGVFVTTISYRPHQNVARDKEGFLALILMYRSQHSDSLLGPESPCDITEEKPTVLMARQTLDPKADDEILEIQTYLSGRCLSSCNCQCHCARSQSSTPMWLKPVLGAASLSYNSIPVFRSVRCTNSSCRRPSSPSVSFNYYLPPWIMNRYLAVNLNIRSLVGPGATIQLPRVIPASNVRFWYLIWAGHVDGIKKHIRQGVVYCPTDRTDYGASILQYGIASRRYEMLDFFLDSWEPSLKRNGVPKDATALARRHLGLQLALQSGRQTLERIINLDLDQTKFPRSEITNAITNAIMKQDIVDLLVAITRTPASINHFDEHGEAPIHQAARRGHSHMIRILIEKGFHAAHTACTIARNNQVEILKALLAKKPALVRARDANGVIPLMTLATHQRYNRHEFADILKMMLDCGADLEAKSMRGLTALGFAAQTRSTVGVAALLTVGARIDNVDDDNGNILHQAARSCTFQMIDLLYSWNLETLYGFHLGLHWNRETPWDTFRWSMSFGDKLPDNYFSRIPSRQDAVAFVRLFRKVRDESLQLDIDTLTSVLQHLHQRNTELAIMYLEPLTQRKKRFPELHEQAETFRVVGIQTRQDMWDAAIESVEENIEVFMDEMKMSPWEMQSIWDGWPDAIDYTGVRDYHGTEAEEYPIFESSTL
ncbi:hypothetical protein V8F33_005833 [Rhypophila sp. PSN 637]